MAKACQGYAVPAPCWSTGPDPLGRAALRGQAVLLCDVTQFAPTVGGAGDAVNARERQQFEEFMTSRWAGLVRLAFGLPGDRWLAGDLAQPAVANAYASWWRVRRGDDRDAYVR